MDLLNERNRIVTFDEARQKHLAALDGHYQTLRKIVADPNWCNVLFPPFKKAFEDLKVELSSIERLNGAGVEASRT